MRDWTKLLLAACVVALGAGLFVLERRISQLEAELAASRTDTSIAATPVVLNPQRSVVEIQRWTPEALQIVPVPPSPATPRIERQPSGEINGVPYYYIPLGNAEG